MSKTILTIGHSTHSWEAFVALLRLHNVDFVCDVRTRPSSRFNPHFAKSHLTDELLAVGIGYAHHHHLGGLQYLNRCDEIDWQKIQSTPDFARELDMAKSIVENGLTVALMCSEADPEMCHRKHILAKVLEDDGYEIRHILRDGTLIGNAPAVAA